VSWDGFRWVRILPHTLADGAGARAERRRDPAVGGHLARGDGRHHSVAALLKGRQHGGLTAAEAGTGRRGTAPRCGSIRIEIAKLATVPRIWPLSLLPHTLTRLEMGCGVKVYLLVKGLARVVDSC
jgi:hypothetical protein